MEERENIKINENSIGEVHIADEVIATIIGLATTEVEGVAAMAGNLTNELISKVGIKNLSKGVKLDRADGSFKVELSIVIKFGYSIPKVTAAIQEKVRATVDTMTGLSIDEISIKIASLEMED